MPAGLLALLFALMLIFLLPLFVADLMVQGLVKLGFSPLQGLVIVIAVFLGSVINLPIKELPPTPTGALRVRGLFGLERWVPVRAQRRIIAMNMGGCIIPCAVVAYQLFRLQLRGDLMAAAIAITVNVILCRWISRIIPGVGVIMPPLVPGLMAGLSALLLAPENAPPVAFCAGVLGPLIGGDLLRLRQLKNLGFGSFSIGGAGTFDGIVITAFIALLLVP